MNCPKCSEELTSRSRTCPTCGTTLKEENTIPYPLRALLDEQENTFGGIIGALLGALLGAGSIFLSVYVNELSILPGVILSACTLYGYKLFAKRLRITGLIICIALMLVTPYLSYRIGMSFLLSQEASHLNLNFTTFLRYLPQLLERAGAQTAYYTGLLKLYIFTALGAVGITIHIFKKQED